eukprot:TRINITY_DN10396_c0_g1_i5.p1 TRINITY_DN10396_c0_g1~~TRINITY_DN10396_c0_g1_i5.p1  ORF type:complete len:847 (+),score=73.20 TRINITY_DN10396_c0_g1_i5:106-2646(+)
MATACSPCASRESVAGFFSPGAAASSEILIGALGRGFPEWRPDLPSCTAASHICEALSAVHACQGSTSPTHPTITYPLVPRSRSEVREPIARFSPSRVLTRNRSQSASSAHSPSPASKYACLAQPAPCLTNPNIISHQHPSTPHSRLPRCLPPAPVQAQTTRPQTPNAKNLTIIPNNAHSPGYARSCSRGSLAAGTPRVTTPGRCNSHKAPGMPHTAEASRPRTPGQAAPYQSPHFLGSGESEPHCAASGRSRPPSNSGAHALRQRSLTPQKNFQTTPRPRQSAFERHRGEGDSRDLQVACENRSGFDQDGSPVRLRSPEPASLPPPGARMITPGRFRARQDAACNRLQEQCGRVWQADHSWSSAVNQSGTLVRLREANPALSPAAKGHMIAPGRFQATKELNGRESEAFAPRQPATSGCPPRITSSSSLQRFFSVSDLKYTTPPRSRSPCSAYFQGSVPSMTPPRSRERAPNNPGLQAVIGGPSACGAQADWPVFPSCQQNSSSHDRLSRSPSQGQASADTSSVRAVKRSASRHSSRTSMHERIVQQAQIFIRATSSELEPADGNQPQAAQRSPCATSSALMPPSPGDEAAGGQYQSRQKVWRASGASALPPKPCSPKSGDKCCPQNARRQNPGLPRSHSQGSAVRPGLKIPAQNAPGSFQHAQRRCRSLSSIRAGGQQIVKVLDSMEQHVQRLRRRSRDQSPSADRGRDVAEGGRSAHGSCSVSPDKAANPEIHPGELQKEDLIGCGSFGAVWRGRWRNQQVAIKICKVTSSCEAKMLQAEISYLCRLRHQRLVSFLGFANEHLGTYNDLESPEDCSLGIMFAPLPAARDLDMPPQLQLLMLLG